MTVLKLTARLAIRFPCASQRPNKLFNIPKIHIPESNLAPIVHEKPERVLPIQSEFSYFFKPNLKAVLKMTA